MERRLAAILAADMAGYSRLVERDEEGVLARQKTYRRELIDPGIAGHRGRIVKTSGDGMLAEFPSAQDAVRCAIGIQGAMAGREGVQPADGRIAYRMGINLGDIVFDDGDIFGDGVNVAARLEALAEPGGVCVSDVVHQLVADRIPERFRDMGRQRVKNISRPILVWQWVPNAPAREPEPHDTALQQRVQFARASDGVQIAWASVGRGTPLLKAPNWLSHLDYEWRSPIFAPMLAGLARHCRLVRFDQRGNGLSDRDVEAISPQAMVSDMVAVADAAGLERFALLGISQGAAFSTRFAAEHPDRVSCLILLNGFLRGRVHRPGPDQRKLFETGVAMIRDGWGSNNPVFRSFFTSSMIPDAPPEVTAQFDELQRMATDAEAAGRIWEMNNRLNMVEMARRVRAPCLVMHCVGDRMAPIEEGRLIAKSIPTAEIIELPGNNHVPLSGTAAFDDFIRETAAFLASHSP